MLNTTLQPNSDNKLDQILDYSRRAFEAAEKTRKYTLWNMIIQFALIILPIIGLAIAIPFMLNSFTKAYSGLL